MKSDLIKKGVERAPHRALLYALGCTRKEFDKPFIGIINSYSEISSTPSSAPETSGLPSKKKNQ